jgi:hypothetical protein
VDSNSGGTSSRKEKLDSPKQNVNILSLEPRVNSLGIRVPPVVEAALVDEEAEDLVVLCGCQSALAQKPLDFSIGHPAAAASAAAAHRYASPRQLPARIIHE